MPHSEDPPSNGWIPAWKRLGFQLTGPTPSSYPQYYKRYYPNPPWYLQQTNSESSDNKVTGSTSMQGDHGDQKFDKQKKRKFDQTTLFRDFDRNAIESSGRASEPKVKKNRSKLDRQQDLAAEKVSIQFNASLKFQTLLTIYIRSLRRLKDATNPSNLLLKRRKLMVTATNIFSMSGRKHKMVVTTNFQKKRYLNSCQTRNQRPKRNLLSTRRMLPRISKKTN